jgi:AcrR family transcriptional regulator
LPRQARAVATRDRLLLATAESLAELGYAGASSGVICRRAGVSQGALFKHFPNMPLLLGAAAERVLAEFVAQFRYAVGSGTPNAQRLTRAVAALWEIFCAPRMRAVFELYLAARTDDELRRALEPVLVAHHENLYREACRVFPKAAEQRGFQSSVDLVLHAMQGAALGISVRTDAQKAKLCRQFEAVARRELTRLLSSSTELPASPPSRGRR